jgi:limonene-1,2-epoxide hydrolase
MSSKAAEAESAIAIVSRLCSEWPTLTREDFRNMFTPDSLYINMPMPATRCIGPDQAFAMLSAFSAGWNVEMDILHIQGDANAILTERLERFVSKVDAGKVAQLHVMGAFEMKDGKIAHWRDYFDSKESQALMG